MCALFMIQICSNCLRCMSPIFCLSCNIQFVLLSPVWNLSANQYPLFKKDVPASLQSPFQMLLLGVSIANCICSTNRVRSKEFKKRAMQRIMFTLAPGLEIGVGV